MSIGLTLEEMQKIFHTEYNKVVKERKLPFESLRAGYELHGLSQDSSKDVASLAIRQMATWESLLLVINENNARIQSQFKAKGVDA